MDYSSNSLSNIAERYLKDQILAARLKSGQKIIEKDVAEALKVSRAPVREALSTLSQQGLVTFSPRRGHFVLEMPREEVFEVFQIRIALEMQILRILTSGDILTKEDYSQLTALSHQMEDAQQTGLEEEGRIFLLNSLDIGFHRYLWRASGSVRRAQLLEGLFFQLLIVMNNDIRTLGTGDEKAEEHLALINALQTKDVTRVCGEFRRHLDKYIVSAMGALSEEEEKVLRVLFSPQ